METEVLKKLEKQEKKLDAIYKSVEKTRRYFLYTLIVTALVIILPLIGLLIVIPKFLDLIETGI